MSHLSIEEFSAYVAHNIADECLGLNLGLHVQYSHTRVRVANNVMAWPVISPSAVTNLDFEGKYGRKIAFHFQRRFPFFLITNADVLVPTDRPSR